MCIAVPLYEVKIPAVGWETVRKLKLTIITSQNLIPQVPDKWKFDLVCLLEEQENLHTILTEALMEVGTIAIDSIFSKVNQYPV